MSALLTVLALLASDSTQDAALVLERAQAWYRQVNGLAAQFTQEIRNPMLGAPDTTWGKLFLEPPDRFAMRFQEPEGDRLVADGEWLWIYTPSSVPDQVIKQEIPTAGAATPNLFAQFVERPLDRYQAERVGTEILGEDTLDLLRLRPLEPLPFRVAVIGVSRRDGSLRKVWMREETGQARTLYFRNLEYPGTVNPSELTFRVPSGTKVVTP